jgi:hypothetical protein
MQLTDELASLKRRFDVFRNVTGNVDVEVISLRPLGFHASVRERQIINDRRPQRAILRRHLD